MACTLTPAAPGLNYGTTATCKSKAPFNVPAGSDVYWIAYAAGIRHVEPVAA